MKKLTLFIFVVLLTGCSTTFTYNNLDWLIHWYVDDYVDLDDQQEALFDQYFTTWQDWHRNEELAKYVMHLDAVKSDINNQSLTAEGIATHIRRGREHWERLRDHVSPELAMLASQLTDEQIDSLFKELDEENEDIAKKLAKTAGQSEQEREEARVEDIEDGISDFIGRLSKQQKAIIRQYATDFDSTRALWLAYRQDVQQAARALLQERQESPDFQLQFVALLTHPDQFRSSEYQQRRLQNTLLYGRMLEKLFYTLSDKQKNKLINKIDDMIDDFEFLMSSD